MDETVYALGDYGAGRFITTADSSLPFQEMSDCPLLEWLSDGVDDPKILVFGWTESDGPAYWPPGTVVEGVHLPEEYIGNAAQLAADYDIIEYLESSYQFGMDEPSDAEMDTLLEYVNTHGGGVYVSSEFGAINGPYLNAVDIASVNRLMIPMGVEAQAASLNWGDVDGNIEFDCFPVPM
ncbi:MAG: hypothetical protein ACPG4T_21365 [Nannocystaceae bacterium]